MFGDEATTGKSADTDVREGKRTVLIAEHQTMMNDEQAARFAQWFGMRDAPGQVLRQLKVDIEASGARQKNRSYRTAVFCSGAGYTRKTTTWFSAQRVRAICRSPARKALLMELYRQVSYELAGRLTRRYSTSFSMSSRLFASRIRPHIYAVYGMVRLADEIVDTYRGDDAMA